MNKEDHADNRDAYRYSKGKYRTADIKRSFPKQGNNFKIKQLNNHDNTAFNIDEEPDLQLMESYQESFPSRNQKIEESNLGSQFECIPEPCSANTGTNMDATLGDSYDNKKVETENQMEGDGREKERSYKVVLVSNKDIIAREFRGAFTEELEDYQSVKKSGNTTDNLTDPNVVTISKSRNGSNYEDADKDSVVDIISQEEGNDSSIEDISERYLCYICGKSYKQLSHLTRHTKNTHSKEKFLQCTICATTFTRSWSLIRHLKLHERCNTVNHPTRGPYKCPQCTKTFQQAYNVSRHLLTHTGEKPFQCPKCKKTFTQHTGLSRHLHLHKGNKDFKCEECGKAFARLFVLNRHKLTHTDDKPYKCFVCSKSFIRAVQLEGHIKSHSKNDTE